MSHSETPGKKRRLSPFGAVKAFFTHDVRLRRDRGGLQLALVSRDSAAPEGGPTTLQAMQTTFEDLPMYKALNAVLEAAPHSRSTLRHLAAIERQLRRDGTLELARYALPTLEVVLRQFDGLVEPPMSPPLAELRAQIVAAVGLRRRQQQDAARAQEASAEAAAAEHMQALHAMLGSELDVDEATPSEFEREAAK